MGSPARTPPGTPMAQPAAPAGGPPPHVVMMQLLQSHYVMQAISVVARLGVADHLVPGPRSAEELSRTLGTHAPSLYRVLRGLTAIGIFAEGPDARFSLTPMAQTLVSGPGSLRPVATYHGHPVFWQAAGDMLHTVRTGEPAFLKGHGTDNPFEVLNRHPEAASAFAEAMTSFSKADHDRVVAAYDFARFGTIVDVGGGQGNFLATILKAAPRSRGILLDQPSVVAGAPKVLEGAGVAGRAQVVGGSFFDDVPRGGDAYVLSNILHDWNDAMCVRILGSVRRAMGPGATLVVNEIIVPPGNGFAPGKIVDVTLMLVDGAARTQAQYERLFAASGFRLRRVVPTGPSTSIVEAVPA